METTETTKFIHKVSKGSIYRQVYIPKEMEKYFEAGDIVEIKLIKKITSLFFYNIKKSDISKFKYKLIKNIFDEMANFKEIEQVFIFGSFLTTHAGYNDIDIMILTDKTNIDEKLHSKLTKEFSLKFHIISISKDKLINLLKTDPLTRSMLSQFISNKSFEIPKETIINKNHIKFLLMMPEDLLKVSLREGRAYYDALRKIIVIENFIKNEDLSQITINNELEKLLSKDKINFIKENGLIKGVIKEEIEKIIKNKLNVINKLIKNVKKR